jgi:hypothetical protein
MNYFNSLTPAENLLVRDRSSASLKQMLEFTLMDLLLKGVLKIEYNDTSNADAFKVPYITKGENFDTYASVSHEQIFLRPFATFAKTGIMLKNFIKLLFEISRGPRKYRMLVAESPRISHHFKSPDFFHWFGVFPLNKKGRAARADIVFEQTKLTGKFAALWEADRKAALAIIEEVKGNIFLLPLGMSLIKALGFELDQYTSPTKKDDYFAGGGCSGYYSDHGHVSSGFDAGENESGGNGWGGDSGCGGDSGGGDSGCSGCGGGGD